MAVYTLELQGGNFYVGYSDDIPKRMAEHFLGRGSYWTRLHPPTKVLEVVPGGKELEAAKTMSTAVAATIPAGGARVTLRLQAS